MITKHVHHIRFLHGHGRDLYHHDRGRGLRFLFLSLPLLRRCHLQASASYLQPSYPCWSFLLMHHLPIHQTHHQRIQIDLHQRCLRYHLLLVDNCASPHHSSSIIVGLHLDCLFQQSHESNHTVGML